MSPILNLKAFSFATKNDCWLLVVKKEDKGVVDLLASLCKMYETSEEELRKTMVKTNNVVAEILKKKPCLASECKNGNLDNIVTGLYK